jgi:transposase InsO family protein
MFDGGSHFDNSEVDAFCNEHGVRHITTPAYAPWVNGLIHQEKYFGPKASQSALETPGLSGHQVHQVTPKHKSTC